LVDTTIKHPLIEYLNIVLIIYQTTRSNISEDFNLEQYRCENRKSRISHRRHVRNLRHNYRKLVTNILTTILTYLNAKCAMNS